MAPSTTLLRPTKRNPSNTAAHVMAAFFAAGSSRGGTRKNASVTIEATRRTAAPAYAKPIVDAAITRPASAGPVANASACAVEAHVTTRGNASRVTSVGKSAARAGLENAFAADTHAAATNKCTASARSPYVRMATPMHSTATT